MLKTLCTNRREIHVKKSIIAGLALGLVLIMTACGSSSAQINNIGNTMEKADSGPDDPDHTAGSQESAADGEISTDTTEDETVKEFPELKNWIVVFPDDSWHKEYKRGLDTLELYKDGCYDGLNSSITVFTNDMNAEESLIGSKDLSSGFSKTVMKDLDYEIAGVNCPAYEDYHTDYDKTIVKVFYPLSRNKSLQFNIFVSKGSQQGVDPYSDEVKQIIQSIVDENGLLAAAAAEEGTSEIEKIEISEDGLSFEGKTVELEDFSVIVPEGWQLFKSRYGSKYVIKGGTKLEDYESKPYVRMYYDDTDAYTYSISDKKYYKGSVSLTADICGTECPAIRYTQRTSKGAYWDYLKTYMPVSGSESISFEIITDSSELEGLSITDDDVRQIIISVVRSIIKS